MKITCIACQTEFHQPLERIDRNGSMVRCPMCSYIFMTFQNPDTIDSSVAEETNIDQAILSDLLEMQERSGTRILANDPPNKTCSPLSEETNGPDLTPGVDLNDIINDVDYADLPDLSDLEKLIDWDDLDEPGDPSANWC
jgi:predicted Zn finger-like uncharacterized protein